MHSGCTFIISVVIIFANVWTLGQALEGVPKSHQKIPIKYKLSARPSNGSLQNIVDLLNMLGSDGYVYDQTFRTTFNGTVTAALLYINIDKSESPYYYRAFMLPTTSAELLQQLNGQGAMGFRYKIYVYQGAVESFIYVRDKSRPSANYTYRHEPCVSNLAELFTQINKNAAQGYRVVDSFRLDNFCVLYIKDTSKRSKFVYKMVPYLNTTADLLTKADKLGARGYRRVGDAYIDFVSNGTSSSSIVPLYYRDKTQEDCTFSYSSAPMADSPANLLAPLQEQEAKGFIYSPTFSASINFLIFVKFHNCHYKSMNIDAYY